MAIYFARVNQDACFDARIARVDMLVELSL